MKPKDWRNLLFVALAAVFCLGGSFVCTTNSNDDDKEVNGFVHINAVLWR